MAHVTPFFAIHCFSLQLCLEKGLKDDQINDGISIWITAKELAVIGHLRASVADVAISSF